MNLLEAINSDRRFKRPDSSWVDTKKQPGWFYINGHFYESLPYGDIVANDYEIEREPIRAKLMVEGLAVTPQVLDSVGITLYCKVDQPISALKSSDFNNKRFKVTLEEVLE